MRTDQKCALPCTAAFMLVRDRLLLQLCSMQLHTACMHIQRALIPHSVLLQKSHGCFLCWVLWYWYTSLAESNKSTNSDLQSKRWGGLGPCRDHHRHRHSSVSLRAKSSPSRCQVCYYLCLWNMFQREHHHGMLFAHYPVLDLHLIFSVASRQCWQFMLSWFDQSSGAFLLHASFL